MDKYITVQGNARQIDNYLGFGARVVETTTLPDETYKKDRVVQIITVPSEHAEWLSDRLFSGLYGNGVFDTIEEARAVAAFNERTDIERHHA